MRNSLYKGILFTIVILGILGVITAVGFHSANEILSGTFKGNYTFNGSVNVVGNICSGSNCLNSVSSSDLNIMNSMLVWKDLSRASGELPNGYLWTFKTDELATKTDSYFSSGIYSTQIISSISGTYSAMGSPGTITLIDRSHTFPNSVTVNRMGFYSGGAGQSAALKIVRYNSAGSYTTVYNQYVTSTAAGWNDFNLTSTYTIPSSGTYYIGVYTNGIFVGHMVSVTSTAYISSDGLGTFAATEGTSAVGALGRAYYLSGANNVVLIPNVITTSISPSTVDFYINHNPVNDDVALNTDIKARVSRDNGATWSSYITLEEVSSYYSDFNLFKGTEDMSS